MWSFVAVDEPQPSTSDGNKPETDAVAGDDAGLTWTHQMNLLLLESYRKFSPQFRDTKKKKKAVWGDIAKHFNGKGYNITWEVAERKFRNLKGTYRNIVDNSKKTGRGRLGKKKWPYMEFFDEVCGNNPETDPVAVEVGVNIDEEPTANAASGETQEELRDDLSDDDGNHGKGRVQKKGKKRKADCPPWFSDFVADFKLRDDARQAQEDRRLQLLENMQTEEARQAAQRNAILSDLNSNIKALLEKM